MATYTEGNITYTVTLETKELLENSKRAQQELKALSNSGTNASKGLNDIEKSSSSAGNSLGKLTTIAKAVSAALLSSKIISYAESWNELEDRINNTGLTASQTKDTLNALLATSDRNGRSINETAELYIRLSNSMKELGYSSQGTLSYIDTLSNLMTINKTNTLSAEAAINALTKAQMKGKLSGVEAMSVFNAMPSILKTLGKQFNKTESEIRQMATDGKISMKMFSDAMISAQEETAALADNMRNNVGDAINRIENNLKRYLGELNNSTGATKLLVDSLILVSQNVDILVNGLGVLAAVYAGKYITSLAAATKQKGLDIIATTKQAQAEKVAAQSALQQAQAEKANAVAAQQSLVAQLKLAQTEQTRNAIRNQLKANTVALTAATNAESAAQVRLTAAMKASAMGANLLRGAMNLLGGPAGILMIAAGALYSWSSGIDEAREKATNFKGTVDELKDSLKSLTFAQLIKQQSDYTNSLELASDELSKQKSKLKEYEDILKDWRNSELTDNKSIKFIKDLEGRIETLRSEIDTTKQSVSNFNEVISYINTILIDTGDGAKIASEGVNNLKGAFDDIDKKIKSLSDELEIAKMKQAGLTKEAYIYQNVLSTLGDAGEDYKKTLKGILDGSIEWAVLSEEIRAKLQPLVDLLGESYDSSSRLNSTSKSGASNTKSYADEVKSLRDKLEVAKLEAKGLTVEAQLLSITQQMGSKATAAQTAELRELIAASEAYKNIASLKSPIDSENESFKRSKDSLAALLKLGEIKQSEYNTKIEQLERKHQVEMAKIKSEAVVSDVDNAVAMVDPVQSLANENARKLELIKQFEEQRLLTEQQALALREQANYQYEQNRINAQWEIWRNQSAANDFLASSLEGLASSATSTISGLLSGTMNATEAMQNFASVILNEAIGSLVQMGMQYVKNAITSQAASSATAAVQATEAVALATAYQPAAMYASIATQGQAATMGAASYATALGTMKAMSFGGGRKNGGGVDSGVLYRTGEDNKPEILISGGRQYLIPGENGRVLSNREVNSGNSGGSGTNMTFNTKIDIGSNDISEQDGQQLAKNIEQAIKVQIQKEQRPGGLLNKR